MEDELKHARRVAWVFALIAIGWCLIAWKLDTELRHALALCAP